jgi:hypothetical protein
MAPRRLTEAEYKATFRGPMVDIKGREDVADADDVLALDPYLREAEAGIAPLELLSDAPPAAVYRSGDGRFEQVLYPCNRSNVYLVIVVALGEGRVLGHHVLDLKREYSLRGSSEAGALDRASRQAKMSPRYSDDVGPLPRSRSTFCGSRP